MQKWSEHLDGGKPHLAWDIQSTGDKTLLYIALIALLVSRLCFQLGAAPLPDEAYYWLWGLHPSLSYYDHPPLHAWLQGLDAHIFGWTVFGLRFLTWPTTLGTIALGIWWGRRMAGSIHGAHGLATAGLYFASPLIFIYTTIVYPDHLLIFLIYLSASFFVVFFNEFAAKRRLAAWQLYGAALALGLAALTKYNAIFLGLGVAAAILAVPVLRPLLRSPHLYAAAGIAALIQVPVLYWNATNGLSSFRYHLWERLHVDGPLIELSTIVAFLAASAATLSPFLLPALSAFLLRSKPAETCVAVWHLLGRWTFLLSTLTFLGLCLLVYVHFYWNVVAYLPFLPLALGYLHSPRILRAHLIYGMVCSALFTFNYTVLPLAALVGQVDFESSRAFGWTEIGTRIAAAKQAHGAKFVASSDWQTSSQLAFALHDPDVKCFDDKTSQFTFWPVPEQWKGEDAIILVDEPQLRTVDHVIRQHFNELELIDTIPIVRLGKVLTTYKMYRGVSYSGNAP
ncbi:MAG TPA: glycosyltransferase family 39 protein [Xanthobacteraceae bacterium]|nr:glycosyltransferase family 39 protein [Xanthobacteraceae bacterium]